MSEDDAYEITWLVRRLFRAMAQNSNERLAAFDISAADRAVLEFLYPDRSLTVPDIADRHAVSRQHVQATVNRLLEKDLVTAAPNPRHKKSVLLALTRPGRKLMTQVLKADKRLAGQLLATASRSDILITKRTLRKLYDQLNRGEIA